MIKKIVPKLRQEVKVDTVTTDDIKILLRWEISGFYR